MAAIKPLTSAELERLSGVLASPQLPEALPLDAAQGAFYAMASGPADFPPADVWLPRLIGENAQWSDAAERIDVEALLLRFADECRRDVLENDETLPLLLFDDESGTPDYETWCRGYLDGVDVFDPPWESFAGEDEVAELLLPIEVLALDRTEGDEAIDGIDDLPAYAREARDDLVGILLDIRHFWFDRRTSRVPATREAPKVGRNDPCPCGSGRKFKLCHGAT